MDKTIEIRTDRRYIITVPRTIPPDMRKALVKQIAEWWDDSASKVLVLPGEIEVHRIDTVEQGLIDA